MLLFLHCMFVMGVIHDKIFFFHWQQEIGSATAINFVEIFMMMESLEKKSY